MGFYLVVLLVKEIVLLLSERFPPWTLPGTGGAVPGGSLGKRGGDGISDPRDGCG